MKIHQAVLSLSFLSAVAVAQGDTVTLTSGTVVENVTVQSYTVRELKYQKSGGPDTVASDQVQKVQLGKFKDAFKRGLADRDPDMLITETRQLVEKQKNPTMGQFGYLEAARLFFAQDKDGAAAAALDELQKAIPDSGLLPEMFRMKFEYYMGIGDARGYQNAGAVAKKFASDAATGAWPNGFGVEAEMFAAIAEGAAGGDAKTFQSKMRDIVGRAAAVSPVLAARGNVQIAHSLRASGDAEGAAKLYADVLERSGDEAARGGAWLGQGLLHMARGDAANREPFREALLSFLRVRLETRGASENVQAEALYHAGLAAEKWGGQDFRLVQGRCRYLLLANFSNTEWADRARGK